MPRYKEWLEPGSIKKIPRSTLQSRRKMIKLKSTTRRQCDDTDKMSTFNYQGVMFPNVFHNYESSDSESYCLEQSTSDCEERPETLNLENSSNSLEKCISPIAEIDDVYNNDYDSDNDIENIIREELDVESNENFEPREHDVTNDIYETNCDNDRHNRKFLNEKLCPCTETTRGEALLMTVVLGMKHSLTWVAIVDILKLINHLLNNDVVPSTKYKLFKYLPFENNTVKYHIYCPMCKNYAGAYDNVKNDTTIVCVNCDKPIPSLSNSSYFINLNFRTQLTSLLETPEIQQSLRYRFDRVKTSKNSLEDIYDGQMYQKYITDGLLNEWDFTYTFNTDGCQASNSSRVSIWPIYAMINELPPNIRAKYMLLVGLWVDEKEPDMNLFLKPFIEEANSLCSEGLIWKLKGENIKSRVHAICCCVDSVARCCLLKMKKFNGKFGCTFCTHPTENVNGFRKYTVDTDIPVERTDHSIKTAMLMTYHMENNRGAVEGVWSPSTLMTLTNFDLVNGMTPDYMHSVLLGVIKFHTELLLSSPGKEYYAGSKNNLCIINKRLLSAKIPSCIPRPPRPIQDRKIYKASEWRSMVIYLLVICLKGLIPLKYIAHLAMISNAINTLLQDSISPEMVQNAEILLIKYVVLFQEYFGKDAMRYNVHLLLHLTKSVRNWGPLWAHNAFVFENENRLLLTMKKSMNRIAIQIARRFLFYKALSKYCERFSVGDRCYEFCESIEPRTKHYTRSENIILLGIGKPHIFTPEEEYWLEFSGTCLKFQKIICNHTHYATESVERSIKTKNSVIVTTNDVYGIITNIFKVEEEIMIFFRIVKVSRRPYLDTINVKISHIHQCDLTQTTMSMCKPEDIKNPCLIMEADGCTYISEIPRGCREC